VKQFELILGESLCDEVLEKVKERIRFYQREIANHLDTIEENLRKLMETEEYRFIISSEGIKSLREISEKFDSFRLFHFRYGMRGEKAEVGVDG